MKKRFLSGLMVLMMLLALFPTVIFAEETDFGVGDTGTAEIAPFSGVRVYKSPNSMVESNTFPVGTSENTFSPNNTCTRAQILTFLWRAVGSPKASISNPFDDVKSSDYYYGAALWAYEKKMVEGSSFAGDTPCTRSSTVEYLWKNAGAPEASADSSFIDVSTNSEYAKAVAWAVENGVTSGTSDTTFSPGNICDRGQIVTFLRRASK